MSLPQERWIVALATGSLTGEGLSSLVFSDQAAFSFLQDSEGGWVPRFPWDRNRLTADHRTRPGRYDLYLVETTQRYRQPAVRVLAINKGVRINPGDTRVDFTAKTRRPEGEAQLRGRLRLSHRMGRAELEAFKRASSVAGIHAVLAPSVRLYDAAGRFAGAAFLPVSYEELSEIIDGAARNDPNSLEDFSRQRSHEFALTGLAPGTYRLVITAAGYPVVHRKVVLMKDGESLDVDLDAREKP
jgi:hypothetical protein